MFDFVVSRVFVDSDGLDYQLPSGMCTDIKTTVAQHRELQGQ